MSSDVLFDILKLKTDAPTHTVMLDPFRLGILVEALARNPEKFCYFFGL
jgi:hypothetical protein